ncbi:MAG: hypothetical protein K2H01_12420 [Ruminococcus sp.]|nr:hypothetical protein [Ruminococcus sp.]
MGAKSRNRGAFSLLGLIFGFGIGAIPTFIIGVIVASFFGNSKQEVIESVYQSIYNSTSYLFDCPKCGHSWIHELGHNTDTASDSYLKIQQDRFIKKYDDKASGDLFKAIANLIFGLLAFWYWNTHTMFESIWICFLLIGSGVVILVCGIGFFSGISSYFSNKEKADRLRKMSLNDFRYSKERYEKS